MTATTFDPAAYKETTRDQWQDAAEAWHRWDPVFDRWLGAATERMLDLAQVGEGTRVIDIAAGSGGQSLAAARRGAVVLATDISSNILDEAAAAARAAGLGGIATRVMDGESLDVEPGSFDAAISRLGLMYLPDKPARSPPPGRRCARADAMRRSSSPSPSRTGSSRCRSRSSAAAPSCRRRRRACRGRSRPRTSPSCSRRPGSTMSRCNGSRRRSGCLGGRVHAARTGVVRRAAPDARGARPGRRERRPGPRSRRRLESSRRPAGSAARANCSSVQGRSRRERRPGRR